MRKFQNLGLKKKLFVMLVALVVLPLFLLGILTYSLSVYSVKKNTAYAMSAAASGKMAEIDYFYGTINNILTTTAGSVDMLDFFAYQETENTGMLTQSLAALSSKFDYVLLLYNNYLDSIAVIPYDRSFYQMIKRAPSTMHYDSALFSRSDGEIAPAKANELGLKWHFFRHPDREQVIGTVYTSIFDASRETFLGTLSCIINMDYIDQNVRTLASEGNVAIFTEEQGAPISSSVGREETLAFLNSLSDEQRSEKDSSILLDGQRYLHVEVKSANMGWKLHLFSPYRFFLEDLHTIPFLIVAASFVYLLYSLVLAQRFFREIYHPIKRLSDEMSHITYESIAVQHEPRASDELKELEIGFNQMKREIACLIENIKVEQELKKGMEIRALQAQIMPHFLYNTLNSIKSLINMDKPKEASEMLVAFISLLRISVDTTEECIHFYEEIAYLRHYILIMNYRYGKSIELQVEMDEELLRCKIPKFMLQPVVENSILHGYEYGRGGVTPLIHVTIGQVEDQVEIVITDNGNGILREKLEQLNRGMAIDENTRQFSHIGIVNIANRLHLLYGEKGRIKVDSIQGQGTKVSIVIPKCLS